MVQKQDMIVEMAATAEWEEVGDTLKVTGILLSPGIHTDSNGLKVKYTKKFISGEFHKTAMNKPIMVGPHDKDENAGIVTGVKEDNGTGLFKAIVSNAKGVKALLDGEKFSIEASLSAIWSVADEAWKAVTGTIDQINIIENPADLNCRPLKMSTVKLQKYGGNQMNTGLEKELEDAGVTDIEKVAEIIKSHMSKETLSVKLETAKTEIDTLTKAVTDLKTELSTAKEGITEFDKVKKERDELVEGIQKATLTGLENDIKAVDKEFKKEEFLKDIEGFPGQKAALSAYAGAAKRLGEKVKLQVDNSGDNETRINKITNEIFGVDYKILMSEFEQKTGGAS